MTERPIIFFTYLIQRIIRLSLQHRVSGCSPAEKSGVNSKSGCAREKLRARWQAEGACSEKPGSPVVAFREGCQAGHAQMSLNLSNTGSIFTY